ncbi:MAG: hypothetical protein AB7O68_00670 [Pirellulales bacterium]
MTGKEPTVSEIQRILRKVDRECADGRTLSAVCADRGLDTGLVRQWLDRYCAAPNMGETLSESPLLKAVFPIFLAPDDDDPSQQIGSGVLLAIGEEVFALTAAHVTDASNKGTLLMPASDAITAIIGHFSHNPSFANSMRAADKIDMAYFRLDRELSSRLHPSFRPATVDNLQLTDNLETGDFFTFAGFPWRKTKASPNTQESDLTTFTGHTLSADDYAKLGYDRSLHVVVRVRRKKTFSHRYQSRQTAPHPAGVSGGGVFSWPRTLRERSNSPALKLAAIAHSFHPNNHCLAATRVVLYVEAILRNNPHLQEHFAHCMP